MMRLNGISHIGTISIIVHFVGAILREKDLVTPPNVIIKEENRVTL